MTIPTQIKCALCACETPSAQAIPVRTHKDNWARRFYVCSTECKDKLSPPEKVLGKQDWSDEEQLRLYDHDTI